MQGLVSCAKCGYALSRTSTQTSARKIHYYKCIGSDSWRKLGGPVCSNNRFIRQEILDEIVWAEVIRLLEQPALIQQELDRRLEAARKSDPTRKREQSLQRERTQVGKASSDSSRLIRKDCWRLSSCAKGCLCCVTVNRHSLLNCKPLLTRPTIAPHSCV